MATAQQQPSAPAGAGQRLRLVETSFSHPPEHRGIRVRSPHPGCQAAAEPYLAGERFVSRFGDVLVLCRCGQAWREVAAA